MKKNGVDIRERDARQIGEWGNPVHAVAGFTSGIGRDNPGPWLARVSWAPLAGLWKAMRLAYTSPSRMVVEPLRPSIPDFLP